MKNFWLEKAKADEAKATGEFIDLSNVPSTGGRYKEYERLAAEMAEEVCKDMCEKIDAEIEAHEAKQIPGEKHIFGLKLKEAHPPLMYSHDEKDERVKVDWARLMKPFDFSAGLECSLDNQDKNAPIVCSTDNSDPEVCAIVKCSFEGMKCDEEDIPKEIKLDASNVPPTITLDIPVPDDAVTVPADKTVYASIQDDVINPDEVICGKLGEWTVCKAGALTPKFQFTASLSWTDEHIQPAVASYEVDIVNQRVTVGIYDVLEGKLVWSWLMPHGPDPALTLRTYDPNERIVYKATFHDVKLCSYNCTYSYRGDGIPVEHITGFQYATMDMESNTDEMSLFPDKPDDNPHDEEWRGTGFAPKFQNDQT